MIALEWHVSTLRQRGIPMEDMSAEDRLAVLTHYFRRKQVACVDTATMDPATPLDMLLGKNAVLKSTKAGPEAGGGLDKTMARLEAMRDAAAARGGERGD